MQQNGTKRSWVAPLTVVFPGSNYCSVGLSLNSAPSHVQYKITRYITRTILPARLSRNYLSDILRYRIVVRKFHRITCTPTCHRTEVVHVAEHFGKRNIAPHHIHRPPALHAQDSAPASVEVADNISVKIL